MPASANGMQGGVAHCLVKYCMGEVVIDQISECHTCHGVLLLENCKNME